MIELEGKAGPSSGHVFLFAATYILERKKILWCRAYCLQAFLHSVAVQNSHAALTLKAGYGSQSGSVHSPPYFL